MVLSLPACPPFIVGRTANVSAGNLTAIAGAGQIDSLQTPEASGNRVCGFWADRFRSAVPVRIWVVLSGRKTAGITGGELRTD
jgi:hypothetical protein